MQEGRSGQAGHPQSLAQAHGWPLDGALYSNSWESAGLTRSSVANCKVNLQDRSPPRVQDVGISPGDCTRPPKTATQVRSGWKEMAVGGGVAVINSNPPVTDVTRHTLFLALSPQVCSRVEIPGYGRVLLEIYSKTLFRKGSLCAGYTHCKPNSAGTVHLDGQELVTFVSSRLPQ